MGGAGHHRGRGDVDGQKARSYISIVPAPLTPFSSFSIFWCPQNIYSLRERRKDPTNRKLGSHSKGKVEDSSLRRGTQTSF